ncbi:MAG: SelT/SelW/SelH family protein [Nitriliruptorales bacterium]
MNVEIEYCVPCGHLDRAITTQRELLETFGQELETVSLRTGEGGVFKIRIEGEQVLDAKQDGYDLGRIRKLVDDRLAA